MRDLAMPDDLTRGERDALRTLAHALDACGLPLVTIDDEMMSAAQRFVWAEIKRVRHSRHVAVIPAAFVGTCNRFAVEMAAADEED